MRSPRWWPAALAALLGALIAACGSGAPATHRRPHTTPQEATLRGALLQVRGTTLVVQEGAGPATVRVTFAPMATPIYAVTSATPSAIQPGSCAAVQGERDASGLVAASGVVVASSVDDACPAGVEPPPPRAADPGPSPSPTPPPASPGPGPVVFSGQVLSLGGGAISIGAQQGDPQVVVLSPGVQLFLFQPSGPAALAVPSCVVVQGTRSRNTIAAHRIVDWPPGTQC